MVDVAVTDGHVAAVIAQAPAMDNRATVFRLLEYAGVGMLLKLTGFGIVDIVRSVFGLAPRLVPAGAVPGAVGMMTTPDTLPGLQRIKAPGWQNALCARLALTLGFYRPEGGPLAVPHPDCDLRPGCARGPRRRRSDCTPGGQARHGHALSDRPFRHVSGPVV